MIDLNLSWLTSALTLVMIVPKLASLVEAVRWVDGHIVVRLLRLCVCLPLLYKFVVSSSSEGGGNHSSCKLAGSYGSKLSNCSNGSSA